MTYMRENRPYHSGKQKKVRKNVLVPSMSSCTISANPKRKNDLCRFLSCGQSVFQAERKRKVKCTYKSKTLHQ